MNLLRSAVLGFLLLVVTLSVVAAWSRSAGYLAEARPGLVLAAAGLYSTGFLVFGAIWAVLARITEGNRHAAALEARSGIGARFRVGILSLAGLLTPFNVGTDILRSMLGRHYLGLEYAQTAAASILTRECKLHVSLALLVAVVAGMGVSSEASRGRILAAFAGLVGLALVLVAFRSNAAAGLTRSLGIGRLAEATRGMSRQLSWSGRGSIYLLFAVGFAAEWEALRLCCQSLGMPADPATTLAGYGVLHFLSRVPVLPVGIGVVELGGFAWFRMIQVPVEQAGAIVILWGCLRVAVPYVLAAASFATFVSDARR